jgi:hypothetical protein
VVNISYPHGTNAPDTSGLVARAGDEHACVIGALNLLW